MYKFNYCLLLLLVFLGSFLPGYAQDCIATITPSGSASICTGSSLVLTANGGAGLSYQWQKDGVNVGTNNRQLPVTTAGSYTVIVTGTSPVCGPTTSAPVTVTTKAIAAPSTPSFIVNPNTAECAGSPLEFSVLSGAQDNITYVWDFGDGTVSTTNLAKITHTYQSTGAGTVPFDVTVYAYNNSTGCVSPTSPVTTINVKQQPAFVTPALTYKNGTGAAATGSNVCVPAADAISVTATLTNNAANTAFTTYTVDWKDGAAPQTYTAAQFSGATTINNPAPYTKEGTYVIKITATADPTSQCPNVVREIPFTVGKDPTASFEANKDKLITPTIGCGVPVRVELKNSSTGGGLTYKWEIKKTGPGTPGGGNYTFIEGTSDTTKNPIVQFNEKGQYEVKLRVKNACVDASDPDGPKTPDDPTTPDDDDTADEDGKYVATQQVVIVYPQVQLQGGTICETPGQPLVITGQQLGAQFDPNTGLTIKPGSILWVETGGAQIDNPTIENPNITFPRPGTYTIKVTFANECETSEALQPSEPVEIIVTAVPPAPANKTANVCINETYTITPGNATGTFNFYTSATGGTALNPAPAPSFTTPALTQSTIYYVTEVKNNCESATRGVFTVNVKPGVENNTIEPATTPREACVNIPSNLKLIGSDLAVGGATPLYRWQSSTTGATTGFGQAAGVANEKDYNVQTLTQDTWFWRIADISGSCGADTSEAVLVTVTPPITTNDVNVITGSQPVTCEGKEAPRLIGSPVSNANVQIIWESSTTSGTTGFTPATGTGPNNQENFSPGVLTKTTWFRRKLTSGGCTNESAALRINVVPTVQASANTIGASQSVCATTTLPAPLTGSVLTGVTYLWETSTTGNPTDFTPAPGNNSEANYIFPAPLAVTTFLRRMVLAGAGTCDPVASNTVEITIVPAIDNNTIMASQTVVCEGTVPTLTGSTPSGGNGNIVYLWESSTTSEAAGFNPATGAVNTGKDFTPGFITQTTWYRRTVTSGGASCPPIPSNVINITIEKPPVAPPVEAAAVTICQGTPATLRVTGTGNNTYEWYAAATGGTPISYDQVYVTAPLTENTTFYVQAISANKCISPTRTAVTVTTIDLNANAGPDAEIIEGNTIALQATGGTVYQWFPAAGLNSTNIANPVASPTKTTTYTVTVSSENGCTDTDEVTITVTPKVNIVNTFSPNGDGINETWEIRNIENFPGATVEIFNRWGNPVFKSTDGYKQPWDGTFNGKQLPLATYYYVIRLRPDEKPISGSITIIR